MEKSCVDKNQLLYPTIFSSENLITKNDLKLTLDNTGNIFSLSEKIDQSKKFLSTFKSYFSFDPPATSNFHVNKKTIIFWVRSNSYFILGDIDHKNLNYEFGSLASITDQTGGWVKFNINGKGSKSLFEKLLSINLDEFVEGRVIRTSINKINCFVLCNIQFQNYKIICPISFCKSMKSRLIDLTKLID